MQLLKRAKAAAVDGEAILAAAKQYASAAAILVQPADSSCSDCDTTEPSKTVTRVCWPFPNHIPHPKQHCNIMTSSELYVWYVICGMCCVTRQLL